MDVSVVIVVATAVLAGAVVALKKFAPKTKNTVDDKVLERLEALEKIISGLTSK
jgi:hypothetical protein